MCHLSFQLRRLDLVVEQSASGPVKYFVCHTSIQMNCCKDARLCRLELVEQVVRNFEQGIKLRNTSVGSHLYCHAGRPSALYFPCIEN